MKNININKIIYRIRHQYLTLNNVVILVAFLIAASWVWGSLGMMQRNFALQKDIDVKQRQLQLTELQRDTLELENRYVATEEYQELAARESLGLVRPGERVLLLPETTQDQADESSQVIADIPTPQTSNVQQWVNFLFGGYSRSLEEARE